MPNERFAGGISVRRRQCLPEQSKPVSQHGASRDAGLKDGGKRQEQVGSGWAARLELARPKERTHCIVHHRGRGCHGRFALGARGREVQMKASTSEILSNQTGHGTPGVAHGRSRTAEDAVICSLRPVPRAPRAPWRAAARTPACPGALTSPLLSVPTVSRLRECVPRTARFPQRLERHTQFNTSLVNPCLGTRRALFVTTTHTPSLLSPFVSPASSVGWGERPNWGLPQPVVA